MLQFTTAAIPVTTCHIGITSPTSASHVGDWSTTSMSHVEYLQPTTASHVGGTSPVTACHTGIISPTFASHVGDWSKTYASHVEDLEPASASHTGSMSPDTASHAGGIHMIENRRCLRGKPRFLCRTCEGSHLTRLCPVTTGIPEAWSSLKGPLGSEPSMVSKHSVPYLVYKIVTPL
jgi:hypothetical protein